MTNIILHVIIFTAKTIILWSYKVKSNQDDRFLRFFLEIFEAESLISRLCPFSKINPVITRRKSPRGGNIEAGNTGEIVVIYISFKLN